MVEGDPDLQQTEGEDLEMLTDEGETAVLLPTREGLSVWNSYIYPLMISSEWSISLLSRDSLTTSISVFNQVQTICLPGFVGVVTILNMLLLYIGWSKKCHNF